MAPVQLIRHVNSIPALAPRPPPQVDGVLSSRNESDMAHVNTMKTKFMECWDGLRVANGSVGGTKDGGSDWVLVIGATK